MGSVKGDQLLGKNCYNQEDDDSSYEEQESDHSDDDPSFDLEKEIQYSFSRLSVTRKLKSRISKETKDGSEETSDVVETDVPELGEEDKKSFEAVQKKIEAGELEKLKVDQCKVYLRKYGLRLTGNKATLILRIKEHLDILNGDGERKYPMSSFVLNCKGDACTGDIVMFEQNVYEMFNIASRSATGPPCGTRIIAGRIVKESYGAAKQQHTFTIEVLWSKGVKPLPPLHPLLIKGRNLYRLKTMRQKWKNEGERQKILTEKHARGALARSTREVRVQEKEMKKVLRANRAPKTENLAKEKEKTGMSHSQSNKPFGSFETHPQMRNNQRQAIPSVLVSNSFHNQADGRSTKLIHPHHQIQRQHSTSMAFQIQNHGNRMNSFGNRNQFQNHGNGMNLFDNRNQFQNQHLTNSFRPRQEVYVQNGNAFHNQSFERKQVCRYYARGQCYYADRCKYLHENKENY